MILDEGMREACNEVIRRGLTIERAGRFLSGLRGVIVSGKKDVGLTNSKLCLVGVGGMGGCLDDVDRAEGAEGAEGG